MNGCVMAGEPRTEKLGRVDKGHAELMKRVLAATRRQQPFEPGLEAAYGAQSVTLAALDSIAGAQSVPVLP
jgi:hypothetical protein